MAYNFDYKVKYLYRDYWNNNMMFLRDDQNKIVGHVILDFQVVRYNSPALDIGNFMYTSMQPEVRRAHLPELLSLYLETLKSTSRDLGHPIEMSYDVRRSNKYMHKCDRMVISELFFSLKYFASFRNYSLFFVRKSNMGSGLQFGYLLKLDTL